MIQEDQEQVCSSNGVCENSVIRSSSSSSKKVKQTKVPQRGLGVAQLEKIRIEEQQKKDVNFSPPPIENVSYTPPSPTLPLIPSNFTSSSPLYRTHSMPNVENLHMGSIPPLNPPTNGGFNLGWPPIPLNGNGNGIGHGNGIGNVNLPKLWHHELRNDQKGENHSFLRDLGSQYETCSIAPLPNVLPKPQYYQHQQSSTSLVNNGSSTNLTTSSSTSCSSFVPNFTIEPPSNQNYFSNYLPSWPDDQKVTLGTKRSCPFSLDDPPIPIFRSTFAPISNVLCGAKESPSCRNGGTMHNLEPPVFRDYASCPRVIHEPTTSSRKSRKPQNGNSNEELLTLASSTITPSFPNFMSKQPSTLLASHKREPYDFKALPYQVIFEDTLNESKHECSSQQPRCISLFPSTELQASTESSPTHQNGCSSAVGENIDLNLRL